MKKKGILNSELCNLIGSLGHQDTIIISDAGLPIPKGVQRIDLALKPNSLPLLEVLEAVLDELIVEKAVMAEESIKVSPKINKEIKKLLNTIPLETIPHKELLAKTEKCKAIIRTGEFTPYANLVLICGCAY